MGLLERRAERNASLKDEEEAEVKPAEPSTDYASTRDLMRLFGPNPTIK